MHDVLWLLLTWFVVGVIAAVLFGMTAREDREAAKRVRRLELESAFCRRQAD